MIKVVSKLEYFPVFNAGFPDVNNSSEWQVIDFCKKTAKVEEVPESESSDIYTVNVSFRTKTSDPELKKCLKDGILLLATFADGSQALIGQPHYWVTGTVQRLSQTLASDASGYKYILSVKQDGGLDAL